MVNFCRQTPKVWRSYWYPIVVYFGHLFTVKSFRLPNVVTDSSGLHFSNFFFRTGMLRSRSLDSCVKRNLVLWCSYERTQNNCAKRVEKVHLWKCKHIWQNENFLLSKTLYVLNTEGCLSQGRKRCYRGMQNLYQCERSF